MSIRSEAMSYRGQLSYQLMETLRKNGMSAQLAVEGDRYLLLVQGHDSPMLTYPVSEQQFRALADGGTNYANKKAYNTFNGIVGKDFDMPSSYVAAKNVNGRVVMGLHGVREADSYRMHGMPHAFGPGFLGWQSRMQPGMHLRRIGGVGVMATPMLIEHTDGRMRPGELKSGGYGYYYKGQQQAQQSQPVDALKDLQTYFPPVQTRPRPAEPAIPYKEHITSDVYFTNEKWQEVLSSHGIIIDADKKQLTIQSTATKQDFVYDLSDVEVKALTDNSLKSTSLQHRLDLLNNVISLDFKDQITKETLNSKEHLGIALKPEVEQSLVPQQTVQNGNEQVQVIADPLAQRAHEAPTLNPDEGYVDGSRIEDLNERKGWYREGAHGREVEVGDIWVDKVVPQKKENGEDSQSKGKKDEDKVTYRMSAVINGEVITHEISQKQYDKFMAVDDYQRQRMMSKIFSEVDMKTRPEMRNRFNPLAALAAGLEVAREATFVGGDIAHNIEHIKNPHPSPDVYREVHGSGRIYVKPGVDSPQDIASRAFEAGLNQGIHGHGMGR